MDEKQRITELEQEVLVVQKEKEKLEQEVLVLREEIREKDKFFSVIAHDLRGPFQAFLGFTKILNEEDLSSAEVKEIIDLLYKSATSYFDLLENLLNWFQSQRGVIKFDPTLFVLSQKIGKEFLHSALESAKKKGIAVNFDIPKSILVKADKNMLESVIRNLISNAVKFTNHGGNIFVSAKVVSSDFVQISVKDTGIGMNSEILSKLFCFNENSRRNGTAGEQTNGLGLMLSKDFVEKHGGKIWVESEDGKGSTFYFTIPFCRFF